MIRIAHSGLVLLVGVAGSGKSTFAVKHFRPTEVISSDRCRALICDDEADQSATPEAFELLHWIVARRLKRGKLAVVDATNVQGWARASLLALAKEANVPSFAIVFNLPIDVYRQRNLMRGRVVEEAVLEQQSRDLADGLSRMKEEGFAEVFELRTPEDVETAQIERV